MELARTGYRIAMLCRSDGLAAEVARQIRQTTPGSLVHPIHCDLADLTTVRSAAAQISVDLGPVSLLILNAGMVSRTNLRTAAGLDMNFAVNHLGHFLLTEQLRSNMTADGHIIGVASVAHFYGHLDLNAVGDPAERISTLASYSRSKLANVLHCLALARRLQGTGVRVNCLHPGIVATNLLPAWVQWIQRLVRWQMFDEARGAQTTLRLATAPEPRACHGMYFNEHSQPRTPSSLARDQTLQEALWSRSLQWVAPWLDAGQYS